MNNQGMTAMGINPTMAQLEEQIVRHQKQIRALHFEIAKRQMQQTSLPSKISADAFHSGFQGVKSPAQANAYDQQANRFGQHSAGAGSFGQSFGQNNMAQVQDNSYQQPVRQSFGQASSTQNTFAQSSATHNTFEQNQSPSNMSFEQINTLDPNQNLQQKRSFGHPSQSSLGPERTQQHAKAFERPKTAPAQSNKLTPNGRMINKDGHFLGRVQAVPTEGFAVSIKRLGKPKFFDYKTVAECLQEWANP